MKDHYSNENSFKLKLVKPAFLGLPRFLLQQMICLTYLLNFLCFLMNICFGTVPILQHCMACQRASKYFSSSMDVSESLDIFFNNSSITFQLSCI